jgi:hypothetical protein
MRTTGNTSFDVTTFEPHIGYGGSRCHAPSWMPVTIERDAECMSDA